MSMQLSLTLPSIQTNDDLPMRDRSLVIALVVFAHILLIWSYATLPGQSRSTFREMSISMSQSIPKVAETKPKPEPEAKQKPIPKPVETQPAQEITEPDTPTEESLLPLESTPTEPENAAPGLPDREPDYQAAYLNNPKPGYPMVARRMGWQGRVTLEVEVLENGLPGQIKLHQSSGRQVLDKAAIQTVRGWRFVAARKSGQEVVQRIFVPINFNLKESR